MKSYDLCECGAPLRLMERPTPKPAGTEVLLKVIAAGVCHSDLHISDGYYDLGGGKRLKLADRGVKLPLTMGHENVGDVVAVGPDAKGVKAGDRRLVHPWLGCGECAVCRRGDEQLCRTPFSIGVFRAGGYADHLLVPHPRYLFDIGNVPPERAAPLACSGVTTYGALKKVGPLLREEPIVIIGGGGLGLMCLALHKAMDGKAAIVVDIDPAKREAALKAGARTIDGNAPDAAKQIIAATDGGAWAVIDLVGATGTVQLALDSLVKGGKVIVVGLFGGDITLPTPSLPLRAMTLQGSYVGSLTEMAELLDLVRRKGAPDLPVGTRPLAAVNEALGDLKAGKVVGRLVLTPAE
ncbi:MAG: alcohol dehydrogenase catalytic domain-containing protein [Hyphomicrobiales bacterium]|nr:alcohol dehydrogenase [Hyphomicrobiales bacterium]MDE1971856.1 alcohol dehydrogenase catalytic domain-containing protein [Hyphomicrobiales bacterium]MDE2285774.1 alcohol dehydrogenase catalytic domain-containing protein [Hyphomicrobiales bacterium]